jgi:hypothetical protein
VQRTISCRAKKGVLQYSRVPEREFVHTFMDALTPVAEHMSAGFSGTVASINRLKLSSGTLSPCSEYDALYVATTSTVSGTVT